MKYFRIVFCVLLCTVMLASCGSTQNAEYFRKHIENSKVEISDDMMYLPKLLADYETPDDVKVSVQSDTVAYYLGNTVEADSGLVYQNINLHIRKHSESIAESIDSLVDSYSSDDAVRAVKHETNGKKYAITYEIRPDLDIARLNVIYAVSENVSAFYTLEIKDLTKIDDKVLNKICDDTEMIEL